MLTLLPQIQEAYQMNYIIMPGGKVPIPPWMKNKSMSIPGNRGKRMFDPPV